METDDGCCGINFSTIVKTIAIFKLIFSTSILSLFFAFTFFDDKNKKDDSHEVNNFLEIYIVFNVIFCVYLINVLFQIRSVSGSFQNIANFESDSSKYPFR